MCSNAIVELVEFISVEGENCLCALIIDPSPVCYAVVAGSLYGTQELRNKSKQSTLKNIQLARWNILSFS